MKSKEELSIISTELSVLSANVGAWPNRHSYTKPSPFGEGCSPLMDETGRFFSSLVENDNRVRRWW
jgi:hypothetical protein